MTDKVMGLLSYNELVKLVADGVITNVKPEQINATSIDLTLGDTLLLESASCATKHHRTRISLKNRESPAFFERKIDTHPYALQPREFVLAHTEQKFFLPDDISAEYMLKSSLARSGLEHLAAGWCDAGWSGSVLTLELINVLRYHDLVVEAGIPIGQMKFFRHEPVPEHASYKQRGRYNGDDSVSAIKL